MGRGLGCFSASANTNNVHLLLRPRLCYSLLENPPLLPYLPGLYWHSDSCHRNINIHCAGKSFFSLPAAGSGSTALIRVKKHNRKRTGVGITWPPLLLPQFPLTVPTFVISSVLCDCTGTLFSPKSQLLKLDGQPSAFQLFFQIQIPSF